MSSKKIFVNIGVAFWVIILILALAACSTQTQAEQEPDRVSLQLNWVFQTQFAGFFVAEKQGLYTAENLTVNILPGAATFNPIDKVIAKEVDFAVITDPIDVLKSREAGQKVIALAAIYQKNPNVWISLADKNINSAKDMIGKRIGVKVVGESSYRTLLAAAGIDREQIKDKEIVISDFTIRPIIDDQVDVLHDYALDGPLIAKRQGYELNIITLADEGVLLPNTILITHEDLVKTNPDLVKRFMNATIKGWEVAVQDPDAGLEATLQFDETLDVTHQTDMMEATIALVSPETSPIGYMDDKMWEQITQIALDQELISAPIELDQIYTIEFLP